MIKRYGGPTPGEFLVAWFRRHGIEVDLVRLEDRVLAEKERRKFNDAAGVEHVRSLAIAVKKARRESEVSEFDWRLNPNSDTLYAAIAAQQARTAAEKGVARATVG